MSFYESIPLRFSVTVHCYLIPVSPKHSTLQANTWCFDSKDLSMTVFLSNTFLSHLSPKMKQTLCSNVTQVVLVWLYQPHSPLSISDRELSVSSCLTPVNGTKTALDSNNLIVSLLRNMGWIICDFNGFTRLFKHSSTDPLNYACCLMWKKSCTLTPVCDGWSCDFWVVFTALERWWSAKKRNLILL